MAYIDTKTELLLDSSDDIVAIAKRMSELKDRLGCLQLENVWSSASYNTIAANIQNAFNRILEEAAKVESFGSALQLIAQKYQEAEEAIIGELPGSMVMSQEKKETSQPGKDKRNWWNKFVDWIFRKQPDEYDTTNKEQEKAADLAMKKELYQVLQDEKYSVDHWDQASVEERKQILQDYMNEVIRIYGLKDVKTSIVWDDKAQYSSSSITWGYYTHGNHRVTLNEQALTDSVGTWDSYELLETVSHELRHAYQHEAVDHPTRYLVSKETIDSWKTNFSNYISSGDDYEGYRAQPVEVDARDFQVTRNSKF